MAVRAVGALDLACQVVDGDEFLGPGRQVTQSDLAVGQLFTDDHGEVGVLTCGSFELLAEFAVGRAISGRDPGRSKIRGDREATGRVGGIRADDDGDRPGVRQRPALRSRSGRGSAMKAQSRTRCPASDVQP